MRRKLRVLLCVCICLLGLAACGQDPETVDYNGMSYQDLKDYSLENWNQIQSWNLTDLQSAVDQVEAMSEAERINFMASYEGMETTYQMMNSWLEITPELGAFQEVGDFEVTVSGKTTTTELYLEFEQKQAVLTCVYTNRTMLVEDATIDLVYSLGEKMQKAALNTVMGLGTVFVMLVVISLVISCFAVIPKLEARAKRRKKAGKEELPVTQTQEITSTAPVPQSTDDLELVAVIAAAIAASTGQSTEDFVVRSIKRR